MKNLALFNLLLFTILFSSCFKDEVDINYYSNYEAISRSLNLAKTPLSYNFVFPKYITSFNRPFDSDKATLGRVLFYDKNLSKDKSISCASCHKQELAFSDDVAFSRGVENKQTARNSLALGSVLNFNLYYGSSTVGRVPFFWDNRVTSVQDQSKATFGNPLEMNMHMDEVVARVKELEYYEPLIRAVSSSNKVDRYIILDGIAEFVNSIPNFHTNFDVQMEREFGNNSVVTISPAKMLDADFKGFTEQERRGKDIYIKNCSSCHGVTCGAPAVIAANNGLSSNYSDNGIFETTGKQLDKAMFKVPTLRNILLTAPYMHDGSMATIDDVLNHYSSGIKDHENLSQDLKSNGQAKRMNFTQSQKEELKAFLATLNNNNLLSDERYSDPFKK